MRKFRSLLVGVFGLLAFAALASSASAATVRVTSGSAYTATARQTLTLDPGGLSIACDLSFAVALSTTSITGTLPITSTVGSVTRGSGGNCSGGATLTLSALPWSLSATNGTGRADGTVLTINRAQFTVGIGALSCTYTGNVAGTVGSSGTALSVNTSVPLTAGGFLCPSPGRLQGTFAISPALALTLS